MLGLYIHIPFCGKICSYCDFVKFIPKSEDIIDKYLEKLVSELNSFSKYFNNIKTIFIGGGTPNLLNDNQLEYLLKSLTLINTLEFSIEINPEYYTPNQGLLFKKYNINRVSIGVQTFNEDLLKKLNRGHSISDVYRTVNSLREIGINNISIDLIYAIEGQDINMIKNDFYHIKKLKPNHISYYSMILEKNTYFYYKYVRNLYKPIDEDTNYLMSKYILKRLKRLKYRQYEISNFCKKNYISYHNKNYWDFGEYIGIGLNSSSFYNNTRYKNQRIMSRYLSNTLFEKNVLDKKDLISEYMIMNLRKIEGININTVNNLFNIDILSMFPKIYDMINYKILKIDKNNNLFLSKKGIFLANIVYEIFV